MVFFLMRYNKDINININIKGWFYGTNNKEYNRKPKEKQF